MRLALLRSAITLGHLEGVYKEDTGKPALRAKDLGQGWWTVLPKGADAACWRPSDGRPPMIVFDSQAAPSLVRMTPALRSAYAECGFAELVLYVPPVHDLGVLVMPGGRPAAIPSGQRRLFIAGPPGKYVLKTKTGQTATTVDLRARERRIERYDGYSPPVGVLFAASPDATLTR